MDACGLGIRPRLLAQFVALVDHGDLPRAAANLQTTPRALSRAVRELERDVGEPLIAESDRCVTLTPAGRLLTRSARRVLEAVDRLEAVVRSDRSTLRVAHLANADTLAVVLDQVVAEDPRQRIEEQAASESRQLQDLRRHRLDVAICPVPDPLDDDLHGELLRLDPLVAATFTTGGSQAPVDPSTTAMLAPVYGAAWPAHDELVDAFAAASGCTFDRALIPAGSGRELSALQRRARGRHVIVASSTLDPGLTSSNGLEPVQAYLPWHIVWRRNDDSPRVGDFLARAREVARERRWLEPVPVPVVAVRHLIHTEGGTDASDPRDRR